MNRESFDIVIEFFNMTEGEFLNFVFLFPISFFIWAAGIYFASLFSINTIKLWESKFINEEKKDEAGRY